MKCVTCWIKMDWPAHVLRLLSHAGTQNTHTLTLWINSCLRYQSISRSLGPDVNKLGYRPNSNPILYIFHRCQSVRMKCCLLALGKFLLSFLAKCSSSFICLSMYKCVRMKSFVTCQIWCYFQLFSDRAQTKSHRLPRNCNNLFPANHLLSDFLCSLFGDSNAAMSSISGKWSTIGFSFNVQQWRGKTQVTSKCNY